MIFEVQKTNYSVNAVWGIIDLNQSNAGKGTYKYTGPPSMISHFSLFLKNFYAKIDLY